MPRSVYAPSRDGSSTGAAPSGPGPAGGLRFGRGIECVSAQDRGVRPQPFQLVVLPQRRVEHVDDDVDEVQQCPPARPDTLRVVRLSAGALHGPHDAFGQRADVRIRGSGGDDEDVRRIAQAAKVQNDDVLRLVSVQRLEREAKVSQRVVR